MEWEAVGALAELVGAIGVIASLFYLASQIRRNSESVEAATALSISEATQLRLLGVATTPTLAEALRKARAGEELSPNEGTQLAFFNRATLRGIENSLVQSRRGVLSDEIFQGYQALLRGQVRFPAFAEWWQVECSTFDPEFRRHVDRILEGSPVNAESRPGAPPV